MRGKRTLVHAREKVEKSYDRVDLVLDSLDAEFDATTGFLRHGDTAV